MLLNGFIQYPAKMPVDERETIPSFQGQWEKEVAR